MRTIAPGGDVSEKRKLQGRRLPAPDLMAIPVLRLGTRQVRKCTEQADQRLHPLCLISHGNRIDARDAGDQAEQIGQHGFTGLKLHMIRRGQPGRARIALMLKRGACSTAYGTLCRFGTNGFCAGMGNGAFDTNVVNRWVILCYPALQLIVARDQPQWRTPGSPAAL